MGRAPCCDKANVKKGPWSPEEDAKLKSYIEQNGTGGNWIALPQKIGLKRCGKSCRLRWLNYLRPNLKHGGFSEEEDRIICSLYITIGSRWSIIAAQLPGRTDNDIKNYWNTKLKKKLLGKQRKDQQQAARRGKQPVNPNNVTSNNNIINDNAHQSPYWPEMPVLAPLQAYEQSFYVPSAFGRDVGVLDEEIDGMEFLSVNNNSNSSGVGWWSDLVCAPVGGNGLEPGQGGMMMMMPEYDFSELASAGGIVGDV